MSTSIFVYPIDGSSVSLALEGAYDPVAMWVVHSIETLTSKPSLQLGRLWHLVGNGDIAVSTVDLCSALREADQIVTLDMRAESDCSLQLLIEDGVVVVDTITSTNAITRT